VTATYSRTGGETVLGSPYTISATLAPVGVLSNYDITYNTANFTIEARPIEVTADDQSKVYGQPDPALTYQITSGSLAFSDAFSGALTRDLGELIGTYDITQGTLALNSNYSLTFVEGTFTITTGFNFFGFHSPIGGSVENTPPNGGSFSNPLKAFKLGSTIPVKFSATWKTGGAPLLTGIHTLQAIKYSSALDSDPPIDATPTDSATTGNQFRLTDGQWHFNLSTKGGFSQGTWLLKATLVDGSIHTVWITIKK
jgi:MBG domain (YGX type)